MAGIVARVIASFDRIPAWQAFVFMAITGAIESLALFGTSAPLHSRAWLEFLPIFGFAAIVTLALGLVVFSRPVVVRQDKGSLVERFLVKLRDFGVLVAFQGVIAIVILAPTLFAKYSSPATADGPVNMVVPATLSPRSTLSRAMGDMPPPSTPPTASPSNSATTADSAAPVPPAAASSTSAGNSTASATTRSPAPISTPEKLPFRAPGKSSDGKAPAPREVDLDGEIDQP